MSKIYCNLSDDSRNITILTNNYQDYGFKKFSSYVISTCTESYKYISQESISISLVDFLSLYQHLSHFESNYNLEFDVDKNILNIHKKNDIKRIKVSKNELLSKLKKEGFKRSLKEPFQLKNVLKMISFNSAASFSVPGAGKTTEALAFYAFKKTKKTKIVVISPKNAFQSWDNEIKECFKDHEPFYRLKTSNHYDLKQIFKSNPNLLINYERLHSIRDVLVSYLSEDENKDICLILDESHRMKAGMAGQWGRNVLSINHLPNFKVILTGTPCPNSIQDLIPQFEFLFPVLKPSDHNIEELISPYYVRTKKSDLGLPPMHIKHIPIDMNIAQQELYETVMSNLKKSLLSKDDKKKIFKIKSAIVRVIQILSNPQLLMKLEASDEIPQGLLDGAISPKIDYVVNKADIYASEGKKLLIWTNFVQNVQLLAKVKLKHLNPVFIDGSVKIASDEEEKINNPDCREYKINKFLNDSSCNVMIANPAAASESISLHKKCRNAIYIDRTYNAGQYLQSLDRIHRLGLQDHEDVNIEILYHPSTLDVVISDRLKQKIDLMSKVLNDDSLYPSEEVSSHFKNYYNEPEKNQLLGNILLDDISDQDVHNLQNDLLASNSKKIIEDYKI